MTTPAPASPGHPRPAPGRLLRMVPLLLLGFTGAPAALGVLRSFVEATTRRPFHVADIAYYAGHAALGGFLGLLLGGMAGGLATVLVSKVLGVAEDSLDRLFFVVLSGTALAGALVGLVSFAAIPENLDSPVFFRVVGLLTTVGAGVGYAAFKKHYLS